MRRNTAAGLAAGCAFPSRHYGQSSPRLHRPFPGWVIPYRCRTQRLSPWVACRRRSKTDMEQGNPPGQVALPDRASFGPDSSSCANRSLHTVCVAAGRDTMVRCRGKNPGHTESGLKAIGPGPLSHVPDRIIYQGVSDSRRMDGPPERTRPSVDTASVMSGRWPLCGPRLRRRTLLRAERLR